MSKTIMIVGYGPGTAKAVAEKFGKEGFSVALIGRNEERLTAGVSALKAQGIVAFAFPADAGDAASIRSAVKAVQSKVGPISVLDWIAYGGMDAGDLLEADSAALHSAFDVAVFGLLAAVDEALPDLRSNEDGTILVANGAFGDPSAAMDEAATQWKMQGLALSSGAKHKLVGLLAQRLKADHVYVGEVMVYATIKNTPGDDGKGIDPRIIAEKHWETYRSRSETRAAVKPPVNAGS